MLPVYPLNSEQIEIQNLALNFANREIVPTRNLKGAQHLDLLSLYEKISLSGLVNTRIPEEFGGLGLSLLDTCLIIEQFAYADASSACIVEASELAITHLLTAADLEQKRKFLQPLAQDGALAGIALPNWCSQSGDRQLVARQQGGGFILNGTCELILNAKIAKWFLVACPLIEQADKGSIDSAKTALFVVPNDAQGLKLLNRVSYMGCQAADSWAVNFKDVRLEPLAKISAIKADISESYVFGGTSNMSYSINSAIIGSVCLGIANAAFNEAKKYTQARQTFGVPIAKHQIISFMLADMHTDITALCLMIFDTIAITGTGNIKLAISTKDFALEAASRLTIEVVQLFGGYGYTKDYPVAKIMQDAKTHQSFYADKNFGKQQLCQMLLAQS